MRGLRYCGQMLRLKFAADCHKQQQRLSDAEDGGRCSVHDQLQAVNTRRF
jgi:hypothetical protein